MKIECLGNVSKTEIRTYKKFAQTVLKRFYNRLSPNAKFLNIIFVNDQYIKELNKKYLGRNRTTDVLAFPINEEIWAEIYISKDRARIQAQKLNLSPKQEVCNLIRHGILHLLGFSHQEMEKQDLNNLII
ncbi:MAG: rRNA maturation RNase YbeY [candidate division WOR-3 bacterium]|nr:rRNA maturation RNase YbeY [candidate division WOR-3 bacterium]